LKVRRISVSRMPGITQSFVIDGLSPEINVIVGPNGSGKSSLCRALVATLWPGKETSASIEVETSWQINGEVLHADLRHGLVDWESEGAKIEPPVIPDKHLASCYRLGIRDLMQDENTTDSQIAQQIRVQMAGGYDVRNVIEKNFDLKRNVGKKERSDIQEAKRAVTEIRGKLSALSIDQDKLAELESRLQAAAAAERKIWRE